MHEVLVNCLGGLSLPRKSVVRLTDRPDMTLDVYRGRKTTVQQQQQKIHFGGKILLLAWTGKVAGVHPVTEAITVILLSQSIHSYFFHRR